MSYRGEICPARFKATYNDAVYKVKARLQAGSYTGREVPVAFKGDRLRGRFLVRLEKPDIRGSNIPLDPIDITANFVTSKVPRDFEPAQSSETILYGMWEDRMIGQGRVPKLARIVEFFHPGISCEGVHFIEEEEKLRGYNLLNLTMRPQYAKAGNGNPKLPESVIRHFLKRFNRKDREGARIVTIDHNVSQANLEVILAAFDANGMQAIQMQPQR